MNVQTRHRPAASSPIAETPEAMSINAEIRQQAVSLQAKSRKQLAGEDKHPDAAVLTLDAWLTCAETRLVPCQVVTGEEQDAFDATVNAITELTCKFAEMRANTWDGVKCKMRCLEASEDGVPWQRALLASTCDAVRRLLKRGAAPGEPLGLALRLLQGRGLPASARATAGAHPDAALLRAHRRLEEIWVQEEGPAFESGGEVSAAIRDETDELQMDEAELPALTIDGVLVKLRRLEEIGCDHCDTRVPLIQTAREGLERIARQNGMAADIPKGPVPLNIVPTEDTPSPLQEQTLEHMGAGATLPSDSDPTEAFFRRWLALCTERARLLTIQESSPGAESENLEEIANGLFRGMEGIAEALVVTPAATLHGLLGKLLMIATEFMITHPSSHFGEVRDEMHRLGASALADAAKLFNTAEFKLLSKMAEAELGGPSIHQEELEHARELGDIGAPQPAPFQPPGSASSRPKKSAAAATV